MIPYIEGKYKCLNITYYDNVYQYFYNHLFHVELIKSEDDEVLFAIAEELGACFPLISDKTVFMNLLEMLCKQDETVVRD